MSGIVDVVQSKGCSRLISGASITLPTVVSQRNSDAIESPVSSIALGPFSGLVICVTGLSKEARKQVMEATERLGGQYSSNLHPKCTHLVVQSFTSCKFEHALKHGSQNGLLIVSLGWFVDSVRQNVRLSESHYSLKSSLRAVLPVEHLSRHSSFSEAEKSCLPAAVIEKMETPRRNLQTHLKSFREDFTHRKESTLSGACIFIDPDISCELHNKVVSAALEEGATFLDRWFIGCKATHVVCEETFVQRYIGYTGNLVTSSGRAADSSWIQLLAMVIPHQVMGLGTLSRSPLWILKTTKEKRLQRLVHFSADLARRIATVLDNVQNRLNLQLQDKNGLRSTSDSGKSATPIGDKSKNIQADMDERQEKMDLVKTEVRSRRSRQMQSICWSISEPSSAASMFIDASGAEDASDRASSFFDAQGDGEGTEMAGDNLSRPLKESEKRELIFKGSFLTILFPVDRFDEMGPSLRTYFSSNGFTRLQILDHIYSFYQDNMSADEIELAVHTDSRYADLLRSSYASRSSVEKGCVTFKRVDFLGSRKSFELLKRVSGENGGHVYELLLSS